MDAKLVDGTTLVLGGARSGKSAFAERLVEDSGLQPVYIATGHAYDDEMVRRIDQHIARRGGQWQTVEAPHSLESAVSEHAKPGNAVLVDCLTMWITNLMMGEGHVPQHKQLLLKTLKAATGPVVVVSNEVGLGIVPENRMAREFRDHAGRVHQDIAAMAAHVYFVAAGLPLTMKG